MRRAARIDANQCTLGLDLATHTGFAYALDGKVYDSGVWDFTDYKNVSYGHMFNALTARLIDRYRPGMKIALEVAHFRGGPATRIGVGLNTAVLMFCADRNVSPIPVHTGTLKKWATGAGKASKAEMMLEASKRADRDILNNDEADAILIALYGDSR
jgi:Holliday junction resolvasome RuvABC endonuclease subunit